MISVGKILEGAFGVFRDNFAAVAIWASIYLAGNIAILLAMQPMMATAFGSGISTADSAAIMSAMAPVYLLNLVLMVVGIILYTASMRSVLRPDAGGLAFLRLGMDELRMTGLLLLFGIGASVLTFGATMLFGLFAAGVAAGSGSTALTIILGLFVGLLVFGFVIYLVIRFSLAFPLTLHRRAFAIGEAWRLSRGRFWTLFGAGLVVTIIGFTLSMVVGIFSMGSYFADILSAAGNPDATMLAAERQAAMMSGLSTMMILQSIGGAVVAAIWIALSGGSAATAARLLIQNEFEDAEEVFG